MSSKSTAIQIRGLGKSYYIGRQAQNESRLKQAANLVRKPLARLKSVMQNSVPQFADEVFWALQDINAEIEQGEVFGVIGLNGSGKSTLLKILTGITKPTTGQATVYGRIGALLEVGTGFNDELTGRENVYLNGTILGMKRHEINKRFDEIVSFSDVENFIDTPLKRYSSGMKVRLAFAVAAHLDPEILLIDEVLAVGDALFQRKSLDKMNAVTSQGRTVLFVSHQMDMVRNLCTRCMLLEHGKIITIGKTDEVVDTYLDRLGMRGLSAQFVSPPDPKLKMQILGGRLVGENGAARQTFDVFEKIQLEIDYIVREPVVGNIISLEVQRNASIVFLSFDTDESPALIDVRQPGTYRATLSFPTPLLKPGYYSLTLRTGLPNLAIFQELDRAINFEVQMLSKASSLLSYSENRPGTVVVPLDWRTAPILSEVSLEQ